MEFCRGKAEKDIKNTNNQRTLRPQVPGRAVMSLIHESLGCDIENVSLGNMTLTVVLRRPSCLDHLLRDSVSEMDFREAGFGFVRIHGPITFKWEMYVSEEGHGPVEGILSVTVGGWSTTDRFGLEVVKQCMDPQSAKKRRVSNGSVKDSQRNQSSGKRMGSSKVQVADEESRQENCDLNSRPGQAGGRSASSKGKGMLYTAQDRIKRYQERTRQVAGIQDADILLEPVACPSDDVVEEVLNVGAVQEAQKRLGDI